MLDRPGVGESPFLPDGIRRHLEGLKRTADGRALYALIERGLQRYGGTPNGMERAFVTFLYSLLGKYAKDPRYDPATRIKARLIQQRLALHLSIASPADGTASATQPPAAAVTRGGGDDYRKDAEQRVSAVPKTEVMTKAVVPEISTGPAAVETPAVEIMGPPASLQVGETPAAAPSAGGEPPPPGVPAQAMTEQAAGTAAIAPPAAAAGEAAPPEGIATLEGVSASRRPLDSLASPSGGFAPVAAASDGAADAERLRDSGELRQILVQGIDGLIREREALLQRINRAAEYLKLVETDRRRLADELRKTRAHSLMDELTGLPRRDVFLKSLEAEIGRVRRYGFAFALAIIDIDGLGEFNARHGREAGDGVLRCYAREILSRFRAYDLVARYGDDEFAILFPNTQKDGAMRALEKVRKNAAATYLQHEGKSLLLPGFSSVLTMYAQGENPQTMLARAAEALDQARLKGHNQLVVALSSH